MANMWRRGDDRHALRGRKGENLDTLVERSRAVVQPGQDVGVQVDHLPTLAKPQVTTKSPTLRRCKNSGTTGNGGIGMSEAKARRDEASRDDTLPEFTAPTAFRGYDRDAVDEFLQTVTAKYEGVVNELAVLQRRVLELESVTGESAPSWADETDDGTSVETLRRELRMYREREHAVGAALIVAQKTASEVLSNAERDLEELRAAVSQEIEGMRDAAQEEAGSIVYEAHREAQKIEAEVSSERSLVEQELDRLRSLKDATRQDLSEFLAQALHGLESSSDREAEHSSDSR